MYPRFESDHKRYGHLRARPAYRNGVPGNDPLFFRHDTRPAPGVPPLPQSDDHCVRFRGVRVRLFFNALHGGTEMAVRYTVNTKYQHVAGRATACSRITGGRNDSTWACWCVSYTSTSKAKEEKDPSSSRTTAGISRLRGTYVFSSLYLVTVRSMLYYYCQSCVININSTITSNVILWGTCDTDVLVQDLSCAQHSPSYLVMIL